MDEKRAFDRFSLWFPVTVESADTEVWAVCRDASAAGIMISGTDQLGIGAVVTVSFRVNPEDSEDRKVQGRIIRVDGAESDPRAVWRYRMAIEFTEPVPELQALFKRASTRPPPAL